MKNATYSAHIGYDETGAVDLVVRCAVPAGVDGPCGGDTFPADTSMSDIGAYLAANGYVTPTLDDWKTTTAYDGLRLHADLTRA